MTSSTLPLGRQDRRKEATRAALVEAAQQLLASGEHEHASIRAITDLADVGFGSFYNYFASKDELFDAATTSAIEMYFEWLDERLPDNVDAVTRLLEKMRNTGRLALEQPLLASILVRRLALIDDSDDPRGQRIRADVRAAMELGGAAPATVEFEILVATVLGAISAVLRRTSSMTAAETAKAGDVLARAVARILDLPPT
jgi:AcrR family transcriptional regulator